MTLCKSEVNLIIQTWLYFDEISISLLTIEIQRFWCVCSSSSWRIASQLRSTDAKALKFTEEVLNGTALMYGTDVHRKNNDEFSFS